MLFAKSVPAYAGHGIVLLHELKNPTPKVTNKISNNVFLFIKHDKLKFVSTFFCIIRAIKKEYAIY
jgi:hypothetical protein